MYQKSIKNCQLNSLLEGRSIKRLNNTNRLKKMEMFVSLKTKFASQRGHGGKCPTVSCMKLKNC